MRRSLEDAEIADKSDAPPLKRARLCIRLQNKKRYQRPDSNPKMCDITFSIPGPHMHPEANANQSTDESLDVSDNTNTFCKQYPCVKVYFATKSEYFQNILFNNTQTPLSIEDDIKLNDLDCATFEYIRDWCYDDPSLPNLSQFSVLPILVASEKYLIVELAHKCMEFIESKWLTSYEGLKKFLHAASVFDDTHHKPVVLQIVDEILTNNKILKLWSGSNMIEDFAPILNLNLLKCVLSSKSLLMREDLVFKMCEEFVWYQSGFDSFETECDVCQEEPVEPTFSMFSCAECDIKVCAKCLQAHKCVLDHVIVTEQLSDKTKSQKTSKQSDKMFCALCESRPLEPHYCRNCRVSYCDGCFGGLRTICKCVGEFGHKLINYNGQIVKRKVEEKLRKEYREKSRSGYLKIGLSMCADHDCFGSGVKLCQLCDFYRVEDTDDDDDCKECKSIALNLGRMYTSIMSELINDKLIRLDALSLGFFRKMRHKLQWGQLKSDTQIIEILENLMELNDDEGAVYPVEPRYKFEANFVEFDEDFCKTMSLPAVYVISNGTVGKGPVRPVYSESCRFVNSSGIELTVVTWGLGPRKRYYEMKHVIVVKAENLAKMNVVKNRRGISFDVGSTMYAKHWKCMSEKFLSVRLQDVDTNASFVKVEAIEDDEKESLRKDGFALGWWIPCEYLEMMSSDVPYQTE